jgi:hypothetical protein
MLALILLCQSCNEEASIQRASSRVVFTCSADEINVSGVDDDNILFASIRGNDGSVIPAQAEVRVFKKGNEYVSEPLVLSPGNYVLTALSIGNLSQRCFIADTSATMPLSFTVVPDSEKMVRVNLVKVKHHKILLRLAAIDADGNYLPATAHIMNGPNSLLTFNLVAGINSVSFFGDRNDSYQVEVVKDGFAAEVLSFIPKELKKDPLIASMKPALTFRIFVPDERKQNYITHIALVGGKLNINFGDGTNQEYTVPGSPGPIFVHSFPAAGYYKITVTGDLDSIERFEPNYLWSDYDQIDVRHLSGLKVFSIGVTSAGPQIIDLSQNSKLQEVYLAGVQNLEQVILPEDHRIMAFDVSGPNSLVTSGIDAIIDNLYANVVNHNIRNGQLYLSPDWHNVPTSLDMIGFPSPTAVAKVYTIHDTFHWQVNPIDFHE